MSRSGGCVNFMSGSHVLSACHRIVISFSTRWAAGEGVRGGSLQVMCVNAPRFTIRDLGQLIRKNCRIIKIVAVPSGPVKQRNDILRPDPIGRCTISRKLGILRPRGLGSRGFLTRLESLGTSLRVIITFHVLPRIM